MPGFLNEAASPKMPGALPGSKYTIFLMAGRWSDTGAGEMSGVSGLNEKTLPPHTPTEPVRLAYCLHWKMTGQRLQ